MTPDLDTLDREIALARGWRCEPRRYESGVEWLATDGTSSFSDGEWCDECFKDSECPRYSRSWALAGPLLEELLSARDAEKFSFYGPHDGRVGANFLLTFEGERAAEGESFTEAIARAWLEWKGSQS